MTIFDRQKYYKYVLPAAALILFAVAVVACTVFAIKTGKTVPRETRGTEKQEQTAPQVDPELTEKYGGYALFDGFFSYSERTEYSEISVVVEEPDGSVVKTTETKKTPVPVLTVHEGYYIINEKGRTRVLSADGSVLLQSYVTITPAGTSYGGAPLFSVSGRTVGADGKTAVAEEKESPFRLENGRVVASDGSAAELPAGFSFEGTAGGYMVLKSELSGLCGLYSPVAGWVAEPVYARITSAGSTAFAAETSGGVLLASYNAGTLIAEGSFTEITVSGSAACAYSEASGWVAFDLSKAG